jgi:serine/threonine-protein kinase ATR
MIEKSHGNGLSPYRKVFFACRSAIRSHAGIGVIEYILPMLVLDAIVFGDSSYKSVIIDEIIGVLRIHERTGKSKMNDIELLKSLGCIFNLLDTLQSWANTWVEFQHEQRRQSSFVSDASDDVILSDSPWPVEKCIDSIINLLEDIPLNLRAKAAASVGMHARSLLLLEMEGRRQSSSEFCGEKANSESHQYCSRETMDIKMQKVVQTHISNIDLSLMQYVLGELNDLDAMSALARYRDRNGLARTYSDKVHEREYNGDFDGVIHVYEQATQIGLNLNESTEARLKSMKDSLNASYVRALLKMGRLESAHLHVQGILASDSGSDTGHLIPSAVEASWRLCSWELLDQLLQSTTHNPSAAELRTAAFDNNISRYQMFCGKALLGICKSEKETVHHALEDGRKAVMSALAIASRENYSRAYPYLITLHSMTEIEEVAELLAGENDLSVSSKFAHCAESDSFPGWNWKARLKLTGNDAEAALPLLNVRISLSRLAEAKDVEAKLWLDVGRMARKSGLVSIAVDALAHAEALHKYLIENHRTDEGALGSHRLNVSANECRLQLAKIMYVSGKSSVALQMLEDETFQRLQLLNQVDLYKEIRTVPLKDEIEGMARRAIQVTEWMIDGGFKNASEVIARYRFLQTLVPTWEKGK